MLTRTDHTNVLTRRALRFASRGDYRKAVLALRQRATLLEDGASWVLLGAMLARAGREQDAASALRTGLFHHRRAGADRRAVVVVGLLERIRVGVRWPARKRIA